MELIVALGIGVLAGCGVWLLLRPRTFQVIIGLSLLSYAVNLLIFIMGWVRGGAVPIVGTTAAVDPANFTDPLPQALVLTAIVISFATTALLLVVCCLRRAASRGPTMSTAGTRTSEFWIDHLVIIPVVLPLAAGGSCCCSTNAATP
jgi:multicomponent K+:H+ antiporter subunit C